VLIALVVAIAIGTVVFLPELMGRRRRSALARRLASRIGGQAL